MSDLALELGLKPYEVLAGLITMAVFVAPSQFITGEVAEVLRKKLKQPPER